MSTSDSSFAAEINNIKRISSKTPEKYLNGKNAEITPHCRLQNKTSPVRLNNRLVMTKICCSVSALLSEKGLLTSKIKGAITDKHLDSCEAVTFRRRIKSLQVSMEPIF